MHDEAAPGTGIRVIPGRGVIDRPAPAGSGEEVALSRVGGGALSLPHLTSPTKSDPTTARGNGDPPTTETGRT